MSGNKSSLVKEIALISGSIFYVTSLIFFIIMPNVIENEISIWFMTLPIIMMLSLFSAFTTVSILAYSSFREIKRNKKLEIPYFFIFWKWVNIITIVGYLEVMIVTFLHGKNWFYLQYATAFPNISEVWINIATLLVWILAMFVVYGITKRKPIGFYAALIQIVIIFLMYISYILFSQSALEVTISLIPAIIYGLVGYYIVKGKNYFSGS